MHFSPSKPKPPPSPSLSRGTLPKFSLNSLHGRNILGMLRFFLPPHRSFFLLSKSHIRGALTTGDKWHFIVVDLNADGDGAQYWLSELIEWKTKRGGTSRERFAQATSDESDPALVAGILSSWVSTNDLCHPQSKPTRLIFIAIRFNGVSKSSMVINGSRCSLVEEVYEDVYSPCRV